MGCVLIYCDCVDATKMAVVTLRLNEPLDELKSVLSKWIVNQID